MKYLITLLFLVLPIVCNAQGINPVGGCTRAHNSICQTQTTPNDMETSDYTYSNIGADSSAKYLSTAFVATADTGTICQVCARLNKVGSPTMDFDVQIWSDSDGLPSTMLSGGDFGTMNAADIVGDFTDCFTEGSVALTNGTKYHVVFIAATVDASNYFRLVEDATCTTESIAADSDGASFATIDTAKCGMVRLYK
jgi:hypothetical protein